MNDTTLANSPTGCTAVLVVHGVGDPSPGDALQDLTSALVTEKQLNLQLGVVEVHKLPDHSKPEKKPLHDFFPMSLRQGKLAGQPIVFAEVFWGQVGYIPQSIAGVLRGIFSLIFGLQAIISGNRQVDKPKGLEALITALGNFGAQILRGPIFAINILMFFATIAMAVIALMMPEEFALVEFTGQWKLVASGAVASILLGVWILRRSKVPEGFEGFVEWVEYRILGWSCLAVGVAWPLAGWLSDAGDWKSWLYLAGLPLMALFTLVSICLLIVVILHAIISLFRIKSASVRHSLAAKTLAFAIQFGMWSMIVPLLWLIVFGLLEKLELNITDIDLLALFYQNVPAEGIQWITGGALVLAAIVTWVLRETCCSSWRLIIGWLMHVTIIVATIYGVLASIQMFINSPHYSVKYFPESLSGSMTWVPIPENLVNWIIKNEYGLITGVAVVLASSIVLSGIRAVLDVANDVTNYLRYNIAFDKRNKNPGRNNPVYECIHPIRGKFNEVMQYLIGNYNFDRLIIVSHSLGTVITLDELSHSNFGRTREEIQKLDIRLITMGCPISHLFQHYFPVAYPPWSNSDYWGKLSLRIKSWLNLYRGNDFVGTNVVMEDDTPLYKVLKQIQVRKKGGHTNYWRDKAVVNAIAGQFQD